MTFDKLPCLEACSPTSEPHSSEDVRSRLGSRVWTAEGAVCWDAGLGTSLARLARGLRGSASLTPTVAPWPPRSTSGCRLKGPPRMPGAPRSSYCTLHHMRSTAGSEDWIWLEHAQREHGSREFKGDHQMLHWGPSLLYSACIRARAE